MIDSINVNGTLYQLIPKLDNYTLDKTITKTLTDTTNHEVYENGGHVFNVKLNNSITTTLHLSTISGLFNSWKVISDFSQLEFSITMDFFSESYRVHNAIYNYVLNINDNSTLTTPAGTFNTGLESYLLFRLHSVATSMSMYDWNCYYSLWWIGHDDYIKFMGVDNLGANMATEQLLWNIGDEGGTGNFPKTKTISMHNVVDKILNGTGFPGGVELHHKPFFLPSNHLFRKEGCVNG